MGNNASDRDLTIKLLLSRMRLLNTHPFFGLLLMRMKYAIDKDAETAYTDGESIAFGRDFLAGLTDQELDFVMMHEVMHVVLQHCTRYKTLDDDHERYNIACDIVVNSNILLENDMQLSSIAVGGTPSMHLAPDGREGYEYTAEQVYEMLKEKKRSRKGKAGQKGASGGPSKGSSAGNRHSVGAGNSLSEDGFADDHSKWEKLAEDESLQETWQNNIREAAMAVEIREASTGCGLLPAFVKRMLDKFRKPQTDWRTILNEFIQIEVNDYSFSPPDRRFDDSPFFLPDFNEATELSLGEDPKDVLFMIDTSGSMSDEMITVAFSEVKGALDQFGDAFEGWLGFFDGAVTKPKRFKDVSELVEIEPMGGGGTSFHAIFNYVKKHMKDPKPSYIIILTDGYAPFPKESAAQGIPVLWLLNNKRVNPPWGKVARVTV